MANPQQPELRRAGRVPALNPDATEAARSADRAIRENESHIGPPDDQRPGHRPDSPPDKPDLDDFADRLGVHAPEDDDVSERARPAVGTVVRWLALAGVLASVLWGLVRAVRSLLAGRRG